MTDRLNETDETIDYRALLIEALARIDAIENSIGDRAMGYFCAPIEDLSSIILWMHALHQEPPDWGDKYDPMDQLPDSLWTAVDERSHLLRRRARRELIALHKRMGDDWRPYWRTMPIGSGTWTEEQRTAYIESDKYDPLGLY